MATYQLYSCDVCQTRYAHRFTIPQVDYKKSKKKSKEGKTENIDAHIDLCAVHADLLVRVMWGALDHTTEDRRNIWKRVLDGDLDK